MNIVIVGARGIPSRSEFDAIEQHVQFLAMKLSQNNHNITVIGQRSYYSPKEPIKNIKLINLSSRFYNSLGIALKIISLRNIDVLHIASLQFAWVAFLIKMLRPSISIVADLNNYTFNKADISQIKKIKDNLELITMYADKVTVDNVSLKKYLWNHYTVKAQVIRKGIEIKFNPSIDHIYRWNLSSKDYIIIESQRKGGQKQLRLFLEAYKHFQGYPKMVVLGTVPAALYGRFQEYNNIVFVGDQFGKTRQELLSNASLYIETYAGNEHKKNLFMSIGFQVPVLVPHNTINLELIKRLGLYYHQDNLASIKTTLTFALHNPDLTQRFAIQLFELTKEFHNWDSMMNKFLYLYVNLSRSKDSFKGQSVPILVK